MICHCSVYLSSSAKDYSESSALFVCNNNSFFFVMATKLSHRQFIWVRYKEIRLQPFRFLFVSANLLEVLKFELEKNKKKEEFVELNCRFYSHMRPNQMIKSPIYNQAEKILDYKCHEPLNLYYPYFTTTML